MKVTFNANTPVIVGILSMLLGGVMVIYTSQILSWLMTILGLFLLFIGLIPVVTSLIKRASMPITSVVLAVMGLLVLLFNNTLVNFMFILFGILLVIAGVQQFNTLSDYKRKGLIVRPILYIYPTLALLAGAVAIFNPFAAKETLVLFVGWFLVLHGIIVILSAIWVRIPKKEDSVDNGDDVNNNGDDVNNGNITPRID